MAGHAQTPNLLIKGNLDYLKIWALSFGDGNKEVENSKTGSPRRFYPFGA